MQFFNKTTLYVALLLLVTAIIYYPSCSFDFVNWDDEQGLLSSALIRELSFSDLKEVFTTDFIGTYNPLVVLIYAIEYRFFGYDPFIYHFNNILLHFLNACLIFFLAKNFNLKPVAAFCASLLFVIHPIHVESVSWVTARKDVLYSFFFLLGMITYFRYLNTKRVKWFIWTFILGFVSVLAKSMAYSFPFVLLLIDWYVRRPFSKRMIFEKAIIGLFIFPIVAISLTLNFDKVLFVWKLESFISYVYCMMFYLKKFFIPINFSPAYVPYLPLRLLDSDIILSFLMLAAVLLLLKRYHKNRLLVFSFCYYLASIFILLRFNISVSYNYVADRFMYLPCLGFCLLTGWGVSLDFDKIVKRRIVRALFSFLCLFLIFESRLQTFIWKDGQALWSYVIQKHPTELAHNNLGKFYHDQGDTKRALLHYSIAMHLSPNDHLSRYNMGHVFLEYGDEDRAILSFSASLKRKPQFWPAYFYRGNAYLKTGRLREAAADYKNVLKFNPGHWQSFSQLGIIALMQADYVNALEYFNQALELAPNYFDALNNRGLLYISISDYEHAIDDFSRALQIKDYGPSYINRAYAYYKVEKYRSAWSDIQQARSMGFEDRQDFITETESIVSQNISKD